MNFQRFLYLLVTVTGITLISIVIVLLASGYRIDFANRSIHGTGIIAVNSTPDGALVYVNETPQDATNTTITDLLPGDYSVKLEKEGFARWEGQVNVEKELVTKIEALLIPLYPAFRPVTFTGVKATFLSPDDQKIAYTVSGENTPGIWLINLEERPFNLNRQAQNILKDTPTVKYSEANLRWSPNSDEILVELSENNVKSYQLIGIADNNKVSTVSNIAELEQEWEELESLSIQEKLNRLSDIEKEKITSLTNAIWSPNDQYILYQTEAQNEINYHVYQVITEKTPSNQTEMPSPTPRVTSSDIVYSAKKDQQQRVIWFPNSDHLLLIHKNSTGDTTIEIIEATGTNRTHLFTGAIKDLQVYPNPSGSKVIILTKFNSQSDDYNLYSIELR